ncbi:MAG TPA: FG-GAP-like repeat-containing protein [archaeon]|nr:FG-GAP-like repeat-containing protein [archaeon]
MSNLAKRVLLLATFFAASSLYSYDFTKIPSFAGAANQKTLHRSMPNPEAPAFREFISGVPAGAGLAAAQWPRMIRIGVVRVQFQPDENPATTGNGTWGNIPFFTFSETGEVVQDPTVDSRSKTYIQRNILFAAQYYEDVSQGKVILIVPEPVDISEIYTLPKEMAEYGKDDDYSLRTANLAVDAIKAADNELDFSKYDVIMVFHAGCGQHTDYVPDSPDDIHPVSINRVLQREILAEGNPSYMGIPTNDRNPDGTPFYASFIQIFPETAVQDYDLPPDENGNIPNFEGKLQGLLGAVVHELGHYFGLPDLYDTFEPTRPTLGFFALMSAGSYNSVSRIPCHPMAWCKVYLGWETPAVVTGNLENIALKATELWGEGIKVIKVPISSTEYFLLENRLRDENFNNRFDFNEQGKNFFPDVMVDDYQLPDGSFAEFDWSIPNVLGPNLPEMGEEEAARLGSGVLIWHIDEEVIRRNFKNDLTLNFVNTEPQHLGVALEEADGLEHLIEPFPASLDPGFGSPFDVYGGGVTGVKSTELGNLNLLFGVYTNPNSISYTGLPSNIEISGFRSVTTAPGEPLVDSLIAVDIRFNAVADGAYLPHPLEGWPRLLNTGTMGSSPLAVDLNPTIPGLDVVQVTDNGMIYRATPEGHLIHRGTAPDSVLGSPAVGDIAGDGLPRVVVAGADGSIWASYIGLEPLENRMTLFPLHLPGRFTASPVLADLDGSGSLEIIIGNRNGQTGSQLFAVNGAGYFADGFPINLDNEVAASAAVLYGVSGVVEAIYVGTLAGSLYAFDRAGKEIFRCDLGVPILASPVVGRMGLPGAGEGFRICAFASDGSIWSFDTRGALQPGWPVRTGGRCLAGGALGDVDGDGLNELVVPVDFPDTLYPGQHRLYALAYNASPLPGYPVPINAAEVFKEERFLSAPSLADLDGDGAAEIILATRGRLGLVFSNQSIPSPAARFILGSNALACPVPADLNGDGILDILFADGEGYLYAYSTGARDFEVQWAGLGGGPARTGLSLRVQQHPGETGENEVLPEQFCYVYPNPVRGSQAQAHIVYRLGKADVQRVTVDIFTASGETVARLEGGTVSAGELANEVIWKVDRFASGVYLVLIKADSQTAGTAKVLRKIAVIK